MLQRDRYWLIFWNKYSFVPTLKPPHPYLGYKLEAGSECQWRANGPCVAPLMSSPLRPFVGIIVLHSPLIPRDNAPIRPQPMARLVWFGLVEICYGKWHKSYLDGTLVGVLVHSIDSSIKLPIHWESLAHPLTKPPVFNVFQTEELISLGGRGIRFFVAPCVSSKLLS